MYNIPLYDLNFGSAEEDAVLETLRSRWVSSGPKTAEFEKNFSEMFEVKYALAVANCTVALHLALIVNDLVKDDEIIVPSLTFVATVNAVRYIGAKPVFCDVVSCENPTIDLDEAEKLITSKTKAIIVMHYGGYACDMQKALELQRKYGVKIIEDACHGPLSEYKGSKLGSIGAAGCFSFFANKNISTGEGGMLITNDEKIYQRAKLLRSHGMTTLSYDRAQGHSTNYDVVALGFNYRLDDIRSSIGIVQLKKLRCDIDKRIAIRGLYNDALRNIPGIIIPFLNYSEYSSTYIYPIILGKSLAGKRDALRVFLGEKGIQTSVHYPAVHRFSIYQDAKKGKLDKTEYISDNLITLPMYSSISEETVKFISQTICDFINA